MQKAPNLHGRPDERARLQPLRKLTQKIPILAQLRDGGVSGEIWDTTARICGGSLLALGVLALAGRVFGSETRFNASLCFALTGASLLWRRLRRIQLAFGSAVALIGVITLGSHITGPDLGVSHPLSGSELGPQGSANPAWSMSILAAFCFFLSGSAILLNGRRRHPVTWAWTELLSIIVGTVGLIAGVGHLVGARNLYTVPGVIPTDAPTAIALLLIAAGLLSSVPGGTVDLLLLRSRRTGRLLCLGFGVLTLLLLFLGVVSSARLRSITQRVTAQEQTARPRAEATRELENQVLKFALGLRAYLEGDLDGRLRAEEAGRAVSHSLTAYERLAETPRQRDFATRFAARWRDSSERGRQLLAAPRQPWDPLYLELLTRLTRELEQLPGTEMKADALAAYGGAAAGTARVLAPTDGLPLLALMSAIVFGLATGASVARKVVSSQAALREREERLKLAYEAAKIGAFDWNVETGVIVWTPRLETMHGLAPGEFGRTRSAWEQLIHPGDRAGAAASMQRALATGEPQQADWRVRWPDGSLHWIAGRFQAFTNPAGKPVRVTGVNIDVSETKAAEEALRTSEQRFAAFTQNLPAAAWIKDAGGCYVYANAEAERIFAKDLSEILGRTDDELFPPETAQIFRENDRRALVQSGAIQTTEVLRQPDGIAHHSIVSKFALPACDGRGLVGGVAFDITEQKRIEAALRESEERFRTVAENAKAVIGIVQGKRFVYANPYLAEISGYRVEEILAMDFVAMVHPDYRQMVSDYARQRQMGQAAPSHYEFAMVTKSGETRWMDFTPGLSQYRGMPAIVGAAFDVTDRKKSEAALRQSEERLRLAQQAGHLGVFDWDMRTDQTVLTPQLREIFGLSLDATELGYRDWKERVHPEDLPRLEAAMADWLQSNHPQAHWEYRIMRKGEVRWLSVYGQVYYDAASQPVRLLGTALDITERKEMEIHLAKSFEQLREAQDKLKQRERLATLGQVAGSVAHHIRSPLTVLQNGLFFLESALPARERAVDDVIAEMKRAIDRSNHVITEMLDYVRKPALQVCIFPLGTALRQALQLAPLPKSIRCLAPDHHMAGIPVRADQGHVTTVLAKLIENACQAMPTGGDLQISATREDNQTIRIEVRDTGRGIAPENLEKIFEPLFTTKTRGVGLGLAIARRFAELNGGRLSVESEPEHGTTFHLLLNSL